MVRHTAMLWALAACLAAGCVAAPHQAVRQLTPEEAAARQAQEAEATRQAAERRAAEERERVRAAEQEERGRVRAALAWRDEARAWGEAQAKAAEAGRARAGVSGEVVWDASSAPPESGRVHGFRAPPGALATPFSADASKLAVVSDRVVRVLDAASGGDLFTLQHDDRVLSLVFSPDGASLVTGSADGAARLWEAASGRLLRTWTHGEPVALVAYSPDGALVLTGSPGGTARLWRAASGERVREFSHEGPLTAAAFSPDGGRVLTGTALGAASLWETGTGRILRTHAHEAAVDAAAFSPDGMRFLTGAADGAVRLWDAATGETRETFRLGGPVLSVAFSPDGAQVAGRSRQGEAAVWQPRDPDVEGLVQGGKLSSFALVAALVERRTRGELDRRQALPPELTAQLEALKGRRFGAPQLVKGEFEKTSDFEARVARARAELEAEIAGHNRTVAALEARIAAHLEESSRLPPALVQGLVERSFRQVFGVPVLANVRYDADAEAFFADLSSASPRARDFKRTVALADRVPPARAKELKPLLEKAQARVRFRLAEGALTWSGCELVAAGTAYAAVPADREARTETVAARIDPAREARSVDLDALKAKGGGEAVTVDFGESAEVAALRKQLEDRRRTAARTEAEKAEVEKLRAQLAALEARDDDAPTAATQALVARLPRAAAARRGLAVVIGNRSYRDRHPDLPDVRYARNDARAVVAYAEKTLGYKDVIHLENATKAALERHFGTAQHPRGVVADLAGPAGAGGGADVFVYYSGHGVPGLSDGKGYLLPVDADPKRVEITGYPLELLYKNLAALGARSVTVVIDACFSGGSGAGTVVQSASPGLLRVVDPRLQIPGAVVVTAAASDEVASWDDETRLGLLTQSFLRGVAGEADQLEGGGNRDGVVTDGELKAYLDATVPRAARRAHGRDQNPQVVGPGDRVLAVVR